MKSKSKQKSTLDKMLENNSDKKNALKKIIKELDKNESTIRKSN